MSDWRLPTLASPQYLDKKIQQHSEFELKFYSTELGLINNLKRITPNIDSSKRLTDKFSSTNKPIPFTDTTIVRSQAWSSVKSLKPTKKRRWIQFKSNFMSCIKSVKCRFMTLGVLLGLILSLGALIPIVIIWQTSASKLNSSPSNSGVGTSLNVSTAIVQCDFYFCEEQFNFTINMTITALSLVITVQRTGNTTYFDAYNSDNGIINSTYTTSSTEIVYTFFIQDNQLLLANTYTCGVQFNLSNSTHVTRNDQYSLQTTNICGTINSVSGNF